MGRADVYCHNYLRLMSISSSHLDIQKPRGLDAPESILSDARFLASQCFTYCSSLIIIHIYDSMFYIYTLLLLLLLAVYCSLSIVLCLLFSAYCSLLIVLSIVFYLLFSIYCFFIYCSLSIVNFLLSNSIVYIVARLPCIL